MMSQIPTPPVSGSSTQTFAAVITTIVGAIGAVLAKKRFGRPKPPGAPSKAHDYVTRTEFHQGLDAMRDRMDANHRELLSAITTQGAAVEKRLDALESAVARLDERTKSTARVS
jgi:hypothetical protein